MTLDEVRKALARETPCRNKCTSELCTDCRERFLLNHIETLTRTHAAAFARVERETVERVRRQVRITISKHKPDASFDDSMAGAQERNALLENVMDEVDAAIRALPLEHKDGE